jgi:transmembrane sensor
MNDQPNSAMIEASRWYAKLASGEADNIEIQSWELWKASHEDNQRAWQQLEDVNQQFKQILPKIGLKTLSLPVNNSRRFALKQMAVFVVAGTAGYFTYQEQPWRELVADYKTAVGENREVVLADGTSMYLNTNSAVKIHFSEQERLIELIKGEVLIETGHEESVNYRPFIVSTQHGFATAMGTRFIVRDHEQYTKVSVFEGAVRINPKDNQVKTVILQAGESVEFTAGKVSSPTKAKSTESAWAKGVLAVYAIPLGEFVTELARYRKGILRCDPTIAHLLISGSFPTQDTDAVLEKLTRTLPVKIESFTRYWVNIRSV